MEVDSGVGGEPGIDGVECLCGSVIVHRQVQLTVGVGPGDMLEEGQELLVPVPVLTQPGDPCRSLISKAANKGVVPCRK